MLVLKRSLLNREQILINVLKALASNICSRIPLYALGADCIGNAASNGSSIVVCIHCLAMALVLLCLHSHCLPTSVWLPYSSCWASHHNIFKIWISLVTFIPFEKHMSWNRGCFTNVYHNFWGLFLRSFWMKNITSTRVQFSMAIELWVEKLKMIWIW
jgi:hypothetical protein